mmetsp:Transcript_25801/g.39643  ORF Transcript_25801/g.39643 Transcript_25801/m.39643 type:complete len:122 (-) Transcript_25801:59-424(-)
MLAQALVSQGCSAVPILTQVVVDPLSDAFRNPNKFVGPVCGAKETHPLAESLNWVVKLDGESFHRVAPSPPSLEILQNRCHPHIVGRKSRYYVYCMRWRWYPYITYYPLRSKNTSFRVSTL